jgi:hypothetical protein
MRVTHVASEHNVADILTKSLPGGAKQDWLVSRVLHDIVNEVTPIIHTLRNTAVKLLASIARLPHGSLPRYY